MLRIYGDVCSSSSEVRQNHHRRYLLCAKNSGFTTPLAQLLAALSLAGLLVGGPLLWNILSTPQKVQAQELTPEPTLAETFSKIFTVNIPASFKELVTMAALEVEGETLFGGSVTFAGGSVFDGQITLQGDVFADGISIDLGSGEITASNVLYSLTEGDGIDISTGQTPTITNSDRGSSQNIFKKVKLGSDTAEADGNSDTLEFASGAGISLSIDTSNDKLTISNSSIPGFTTSGTYAVLSSGITRAGIGTSTPSNTLEVNSGTTDTSGITFTQLTSSSAAGVGGGKVLSVDSGGKIILVTDQTGSTPTAESVLPSATNGMTLYFNGTNWVASDNLFHDGGSVGISNAAPTSRFQVNTNLASKIGVIVQGYTSQTANLQEWRDSSGTILSYVDSNGVFNGSANTSGSLNPGFTTGSVAFQGASGLTQDNANFFWDDTNNRLGVGTNAPTGKLHILGNTTDDLIVEKSSTPRFVLKNTGGQRWDTLINSNDYLIYDQTSGISAFLIDAGTGKVGIGNTSPGYKLSIAGSGTGAGGAHIQLSDSAGKTWGLRSGIAGVSNNSFELRNLTDDTNLMTWTSTGNVGIGTTTPHSKLTIAGDLYSNTATISANYAGSTALKIIGGPSANTTHIASVQNNSGTTMFAIDGFGRTSVKASGTVNTDFMVGGTTGNDNLSDTLVYFLTRAASQKGLVVRGTTSQTANLQEWQDTNAVVKGSIDSAGRLTLGDYSSSIGNLLYVKGNTTSGSTATARIESSSSYAGLFIDNNNGPGLVVNRGHAIFNEDGGNWDFRIEGDTNANLLFVDASTDRVGIGTNAPTKLLELATTADNDGILLGRNSATGNTGIHFSTSGSSGNIGGKILFTGTSGNSVGYMSFYTKDTNTVAADGSVERIRLSDIGNLGIGTTSPSSFLHVESTSGNTLTRFNQLGSGDIFTASASGTTRMVLTNAGNFGLGTSNPGLKLQVNGSTTGNEGIQYVDNDSSNTVYIGENASTFGLFGKDKNSSGSIAEIAISPTNTNNSNAGYITIKSSGATSGKGDVNIIAGHYVPNSMQGNIHLKTGANATTSLIIYNDGNIGIGTTTPTSKLHVEGPTGSALGRFNQTGTGDILTASASGTTKLTIKNGGGIQVTGGVNQNSFVELGIQGSFTSVGEPYIALNTASITGNGVGVLSVRNTAGSLASLKAGNLLSTTLRSSSNGVTYANIAEFSSNTQAHVGFQGAAVTGVGALFYTDSTTNVNLGIRAISSQTANLTEWQNSSGTVLSVVDINSNFGIGTSTFGTSAAKVLAIAGSTAPSTAITDGIQMFAVDQAGSHELRVMDEAGNTTTLSPHNFSVIGDQSEEMAWSFYSERNSLAINADMTKALRLVEKLSGEKLVYLKDLESGFMLEDASDATHHTELADNGTIGEIAKWNYELWTYVGEVVFEKPVTFLASIRANGPVWLGGRVTFADKDMAGYAVIPQDGKEVRITFSTPFEHKPIVSVESENSLVNHTIKDVGTDGFTILLPDLATSDITFHWIALRADNAQITTGTKGQLANPSPSPSAAPLTPSQPSLTPSSSESAQLAPTESSESGTLNN